MCALTHLLGQLKVHVFVSDPVRLLGVESISRQRAAQPQTVNEGCQATGCTARVIERQYTAELAAQVGIQAVIVDPLQPVQRRVVHAGGPEGLPGH